MSKPNKANQGPAIRPMTPQQSPGAAAGANVATKTNGLHGSSSEGNVAGKGSNQPR